MAQSVKCLPYEREEFEPQCLRALAALTEELCSVSQAPHGSTQASGATDVGGANPLFWPLAAPCGAPIFEDQTVIHIKLNKSKKYLLEVCKFTVSW